MEDLRGFMGYWVIPLPRMPVTTRTITCLVRYSDIPINLHLPLLLGRGTTQDIYNIYIYTTTKACFYTAVDQKATIKKPVIFFDVSSFR